MRTVHLDQDHRPNHPESHPQSHNFNSATLAGSSGLGLLAACKGCLPRNGTGGQRRGHYVGVVSDDIWAELVNRFADDAYASVKGYVRT
jgi:hypothetical protein